MRIYSKKTDKRRKKDWRTPYLGSDSRNVDYSCRHGGSCEYCRNNRTHKVKKQSAQNKIEDYLK